jgi:hypothetical protein
MFPAHKIQLLLHRDLVTKLSFVKMDSVMLTFYAFIQSTYTNVRLQVKEKHKGEFSFFHNYAPTVGNVGNVLPDYTA